MIRYTRYLFRLLRVADWWNFIVPSILAFCYFALYLENRSLGDTYPALLLFLASIIGTAAFGFFLNDVSDITGDKAAGKLNLAGELKTVMHFIILILLLAVSFIPWFFLHYSILIFILYCVQLLLFIAYSLHPLRLKRFIFPALFADALYSAVIFPLIGFLLFSAKAHFSIYDLAFLGIVFLMIFVKGLRSIIQHQLNDADFDHLAGMQTFVTKKGKTFSRRFIDAVLVPVELILIAGFIVFTAVFVNPFFWLLFHVYIIYSLVVFLFEDDTFRTFVTTKAANSFYNDILPLFVIILLARCDPYYYILLAIHFFMFRKNPAFLLLKRAFDLVVIHYVFHGVIVWIYYKGFCNKYALRFYRFLGVRKKYND